MEVELEVYNSPHLEWEKMFTCKVHGLLVMATVTKGENVLHIQSKLMRPNMELFTLDPSILKQATQILNRNSSQSSIGRFVADFNCNTIRFVCKLLLLNPNVDSLGPLLQETAQDMKRRLTQNLLNVLLTTGEVYHSFSGADAVRAHLAAQKRLTEDIDKLFIEALPNTSTEESAPMEGPSFSNIQVFQSIQADTAMDEEVVAPKPAKPKETEYVKEGGYFKVQGKKLKITDNNGSRLEKVIVKTTKFPDDSSTKHRIENELSIVKKLGLKKNQYLPTYIFSKSIEGPVLMMKWTTRYTLKDTINYQPFSSTRKRLTLLLESLRAIRSMHKQKIIHRDIKPSNLLLEENNKVKIIDFAQSWDSTSKVQTFKRGTTMPYAAPEFVADKPVDESSDGWSFGVLMYELFEGKPPVHFVKMLNAEVVKNMPKFQPLLFHRHGGGGMNLVSRKIRQIMSRLVRQDQKARLGLANVEQILVKLIDYVDGLSNIQPMQLEQASPLAN